MSQRAASLLMCVLALLVCSCTNNAELARIKADVEAAKAEAAEAKAVAEAVKAEIAKDKADAETSKVESAKVSAKTKIDAEAANAKATKAKTELVSRWNAVADESSVELPAFGKVNFHWAQFDDFPHPTFKGGSKEAYGAFANVLVAFFQRGDNFDYLAENRLFTIELLTQVSGGSGGSRGWSLAQFAAQLSQPDAHGAHDEDTRKALKSFSDRIPAPVKK